MNIIALIIGVALGCGFALMVVGLVLKASNKMGDSKGEFMDFTQTNMHVIRNESASMF